MTNSFLYYELLLNERGGGERERAEEKGRKRANKTESDILRHQV